MAADSEGAVVAAAVAATENRRCPQATRVVSCDLAASGDLDCKGGAKRYVTADHDEGQPMGSMVVGVTDGVLDV